MSCRSENWLLVEWCSGGRDVVYIKAVLNPVNRELKNGEVLTVNRQGEPHKATLIERAKERDYLDLKMKEANQVAGPSPKPQEEPEDYSPSGSSWAPSDDGASSGESDKETNAFKKIKLDQSKRQYINKKSNKKVLKPSYRANAVIPKSMRPVPDNSKSYSRKRTHIESNASFNKSLPDSTKRNNSNIIRRITIDGHELEEISNSFNLLFKMLEDLKRPVLMNNFTENHQVNDSEIPVEEFPHIDAVEECEENDPYDAEEEFNRSDDNVLITNKYDSQYNASLPQALKDRVKMSKSRQEKTDADKQEWVPIGSGKTLIHIDQFRKVNWKSYTIATRTLLLAVFPRRILATHSLTGKRSPAFQNKPAKMCLDPKIISDVIIEITDRFDVKENLVRSIITTKCADECKMLKQKNKKKKSNANNQENEAPKNEFKESKQISVMQQCVGNNKTKNCSI